MKSKAVITVITLIFLLSAPLLSHAHRITLFAWAEGAMIYGETTFSGNRKAVNVDISVFDSNNNSLVMTTKTDDQGKFSFTLPPTIRTKHPDLLLVVNTGEGHRAKWPITAKEYLQKTNKHIAPKNLQTADPGLMNVLGGLACIFIIAGAIVLMQARKRNKQKQEPKK